VGQLLLELAADTEFFVAPLIAALPSEAPGDRWLIRPDRDPRVVLVHRPEGVMGYTQPTRETQGRLAQIVPGPARSKAVVHGSR